MQIDYLYHWTLATHRDSIATYGLRINSDPNISSFKQEELCFSTNPLLAWQLSGATTNKGKKLWDLWQIELANTDSVYSLPHWGKRILEFRVKNDIPVTQITWIAERSYHNI